MLVARAIVVWMGMLLTGAAVVDLASFMNSSYPAPHLILSALLLWVAVAMIGLGVKGAK